MKPLQVSTLNEEESQLTYGDAVYVLSTWTAIDVLTAHANNESQAVESLLADYTPQK